MISKTSLHLIMVIIGLFIAISLDAMVSNVILGTVELAVATGLFILFNNLYGGDEKIKPNK